MLVKEPARFLFWSLIAGLASLALAGPARAQLTSTEEERLQILSDPEALKKKVGKDSVRARFEFFRSQVAPFDVLPFIKARHWSTISLELRSNYEDYDGSLQFLPVPLAGMPLEMIYARELRMLKEQRTRPAVQVMLSQFPGDKQLNVELLQPGAIRQDELWQVPLRQLYPGQMLILILNRDSSAQYSSWNRLPCLLPAAADREDAMNLEIQRYYRLVLPDDPEKPMLSPHPLTWDTISHVVWDGLPPDSLAVSYQQAMLDWLHWGGQLVLIGGAGPSFTVFQDSFLASYLPADPTGQNQMLGEAELKPLAEAYPPTALPLPPPGSDQAPPPMRAEPYEMFSRGYRQPALIRPPKNRPVFVNGLRPRPGSATIPLGEGSRHLLAVERRVGRGRITMLAVNLNDPALMAWPGVDTLIRRVVLRRPEEGLLGTAVGQSPPPRAFLEGPDLSWYRIASRDSGAAPEPATARARAARPTAPRAAPNPLGRPVQSMQPGQPPGAPGASDDGTLTSQAEDAALGRAGVAEWRDTSALPRLCRDLLEQASGITVPSAQFVLNVLLAYLVAVVPLNWLIFRLVLRRKEWAWIVVPVLALGFAVGVERMAAYDMGYDSACDEIDLLEIQGNYNRGHLSRFASLYTTGRARYQIAYPNDPTALALPFNTERSIGGEEIDTAVWQSYPVPALRDFAVQPRSLAMFRAEQIFSLNGSLALEEKDGKRSLLNQSDLELRDAVIVELNGPEDRRETFLGTIAPGATVSVEGGQPESKTGPLQGYDGPDPRPLLAALRKNWEDRPENAGEVRLVAWTAQPAGGQAFEPELDRHRGVTVVLAHLRFDNPPSPANPRFNFLATNLPVKPSTRGKIWDAMK